MTHPALVSLTFDDGLRCQFERAVPLLDRRGFPATFFLVANTDPIHTDGGQHPDWRKINWSDDDIEFLKGMIQRGHEIGAHSMTHRIPELDDDPKFEARGSKEWVERRLAAKTDSYCYPFYHVTEPIKRAVVEAGHNGSFYSEHTSLDWFEVDCRQITQDEQVDQWVRPGCWHIVVFHGIGTWNDGWEPIATDQFAAQMAELATLRDSGAVEVVTFKDGADRMRRNLCSAKLNPDAERERLCG
ncbi:MAG TPA: polysaccharide deacetylase family protein [Candidatus Sulfotelmatobacter sp.]|nr:polysaccharide deacetylase family protein [Candidatus Sulfotelmatobacter sp.]